MNQVRLSENSVQRKALPVLIELLMKEKDGQVRLAVLDTVNGLGPDAEPAIPALFTRCEPTTAVKPRKSCTRITAPRLALAAIGKPAVEGLRESAEGAKGKRAGRGRHGLGADRSCRLTQRFPT